MSPSEARLQTAAKSFKPVLNLGCGAKYDDNAVNLDLPGSDVKADIRHDLNVRPWPFPDGSFEEIRANDVLEHLRDLIPTLEEIHRVAAPGARVQLTVPHFSSANAFTDPTHQHYFSVFTLNYVTGEHEFSFYTKKRFRMIQKSIVFKPTLFNKLVWRLANRYPERYEQRWAWIFPAWFLFFKLEVVK